jgi:hypothetical protein
MNNNPTKKESFAFMKLTENEKMPQRTAKDNFQRELQNSE